MENNVSIGTYGYILKAEQLTTITDTCLQNTLVLDSPNPFPGYYSDYPSASPIPDSIYFIIKKKHSPEDIIRSIQRIKKYTEIGFDAAPAMLSIYNENYMAIRFRELTDYSLIPELQNLFLDEGIRFVKAQTLNTIGLSKIYKYFILNKIGEGLFCDKLVCETSSAYFSISKVLNWKLFDSITERVRNNVENRNFSAALGAFYTFDGITDIIRIYKKKYDAQNLMDIKARYLEEISKC